MIAVRGGIVVDNITIPFGIGAVELRRRRGAAHGVRPGGGHEHRQLLRRHRRTGRRGSSAIAAIAFTIVAFDLGRVEAGTLSLITAGAALGFLVFNFPPASVYMGDAGANLLGLLLGCAAVMGA